MSKLSSDRLEWDLAIKDSEAQRNILELTKANKELEKTNKTILIEMGKLEVQQKRNSIEWEQLRDVLEKNKKEISENNLAIKENEKSLSITNLTAAQLKKRYSELQRELNNTSKALDPKAWEAIKQKMEETQDRIADVTGKTEQAKKMTVDWSGALKIGLMGALASIGSKLVSVVGEWFSLDKIINSTQQTGDKFAATMAGVNNAVDYVRVALATADFSNFKQNLIEAYEVAAEVANKLDELFELNNSFRIQDIKIKKEIEDLYEIMQNVNLSEQERISAGNKIKQLTLQEASIQKDISKQEADAHKMLLQQRTKLSQEDLDFIVNNYIHNRKLIDQARELIALEDKLINAKKTSRGSQTSFNTVTVNPSNSNEINNAKQKLNEFKSINSEIITEVEKTSQIVRNYEKSNDELVSNYVESTIKSMSVEVEAQSSLRRVTKTINSLHKQISDEAERRQKENAKKTAEQREKDYKKEIDDAVDHSNVQLANAKKSYSEGKMTKEAYNDIMVILEMELINKKIEINKAYSKQVGDLEKELMDKHVAQAEAAKDRMDKILADLRKAMNEKISDTSKKESSGIDQMLDDYMAQVDADAAAAGRIIESQKNKVDEANDKYEADLENLKRYYDQKMITEDQYNKESSRLSSEHWKTVFTINTQGARKTLEVIQNVLSEAANISSKLQEIELTRLEAQKQKELSMYGDTTEKRQEIEQKYEQKKLKIQQKYADIDMGIKLAQAAAAGALGIMVAISQLGALAGPAIAIISATTAMQMALIIAQRNAIKNQSTNLSGTSNGKTRSVSSSNLSGVAVPNTVDTIAGIEDVKSSSKTAQNQSQAQNSNEITQTLNEVRVLIDDLKKNPLKAFVVFNEHQAAEEIANDLKSGGSL